MTFKDWIQGFAKMDHPFAEIATAIYEDDNFPTDDDYEKIIVYVKQQVDLENKIQSISDAIEEYKKNK
ncbi:uncharacterized protein YozE (UPF0346 family) [Bacilli bacterium PM5-3]|nr:uncharacterized protein YozE (UPF0346 family) [Bacilli bacterium PM5-3]MDH6603277.1 uncharacterized protein YozE (UPF0346 family) [Bacilli bacterium PM5-9]